MPHARFQPVALLLLVLALATQGGGIVLSGAQKGRSLANRHVHAPAELVQQMAHDDEDMKRCLEVDHRSNAQEAASKLWIKRVDLNQDGRVDYLVNIGNACSGVGANNVPLFAYLATADGYRKLVEESGLDISARKSLTNGHFDISVESHASGNDVDVIIYKFKDGNYREVECLTRKYDDARRRFTSTVRRRCQ